MILIWYQDDIDPYITLGIQRFSHCVIKTKYQYENWIVLTHIISRVHKVLSLYETVLLVLQFYHWFHNTIFTFLNCKYISYD